MRKSKGKAQKAGAIKKKDDTQDVKEEIPSPGTTEQREETTDQTRSGTDSSKDELPIASPDSKNEVIPDIPINNTPETPAQSLVHNRQPSLSLQSKMRSSSFRRQSLSQGPLSPGANGSKSPDLSALTPDADSVNSIYRKQAARLDELEKENRRLAKEAQDNEKRWRKAEDELEELRDASGDVAQLKARAERADAEAEEFNKVVRLCVE